MLKNCEFFENIYNDLCKKYGSFDGDELNTNNKHYVTFEKKCNGVNVALYCNHEYKLIFNKSVNFTCVNSFTHDQIMSIIEIYTNKNVLSEIENNYENFDVYEKIEKYLYSGTFICDMYDSLFNFENLIVRKIYVDDVTIQYQVLTSDVDDCEYTVELTLTCYDTLHGVDVFVDDYTISSSVKNLRFILCDYMTNEQVENCIYSNLIEL